MQQEYSVKVHVEGNTIIATASDLFDPEFSCTGKVEVEGCERFIAEAAHLSLFPFEELEYGLFGRPDEKLMVSLIKDSVEQMRGQFKMEPGDGPNVPAKAKA